MKAFATLLLGVVGAVCAATTHADSGAGGVRLGFAKRDISPPVLAEGDLSIPILGFRWERSKAYREIHDPLYARVMAVESEGATAVIFACDLFGDAVGFGDRCAARLQAEHGVPAEHVFFSCTHTHTSPDTLRIGPRRVADWFIDRLVEQLVEAGAEALRSLQTASFRWSEVQLPGWAVNRRARLLAPYEQAHGPLDPRTRARATALDETLRVLWAVDESGRPFGAVLNFAAHPVIMQTAPIVSADYCGPAAGGVERAFGPGFVCLYMNGPCGEINPAAGDTRNYRDCEQMGAAIAEKTVAVIRGGGVTVERGPVRGQVRTVPVQRQTLTNAAALRIEEQRLAAECTKADAEGIDPQDGRHPLRVLEGIREQLAVDAMPLVQDAPVHVLRVGGVGLVSFPGEMFCVLGQDVRQAVGGKLLLAACSRAHLGYLCSREAFRIGGYEIGPGTWSWLAEGAGEAIADAAIRAARDLGVR